MTRHALPAVALALVLVVAGCSAPVAPGGTDAPDPTASTADSPTPTADSAGTATPIETGTGTEPDATAGPGGVTVYGDLPVNATRVWRRVDSLLGGGHQAPPVSVRDGALEPRVGPFLTHFGFDEGVDTFDEGRVRASYSQRTGRVRLSPRNGSAEQVERLLAHEYVHAVQFRSGVGNRTGFVDRVAARETLWVQRALIEGSAVYVEDTYTRQYLGFSAIERRCAEYRNGTPYERYAAGAYCFGGRYFAETLSSPAGILSPNATFPNTTEQVLHPGTTEGPANLTVVDETPSEWLTPASPGRRGELFVRTLLGTELPEERAAEAAAGWGNDRLVRITGSHEAYVWVLRWDTDDDAAAFRTALGAYLDARGERTADGWRVDGEPYRVTAVDDRTVALVTGNETVVETATVTSDSGNVTLSGG